MDKDWAPEPWEADHLHQCYCGGYHADILDVNGKCITTAPFHNIADTDRIVACVNACAGIPTTELEHYLTIGKAKRNVDITMASLSGNALSQAEFDAMGERGELKEGVIYYVRKEAADD
jgi:hypothetical protein